MRNIYVRVNEVRYTYRSFNNRFCDHALHIVVPEHHIDYKQWRKTVLSVSIPSRAHGEFALRAAIHCMMIAGTT